MLDEKKNGTLKKKKWIDNRPQLEHGTQWGQSFSLSETGKD